MIINLTPHPLHIYAMVTPDRIDPNVLTPARVIPPSGQVARMGSYELDVFEHDGLSVAYLEHPGPTGLPPYAGDMPDHARQVWYVVPIVVALAPQAAHRSDLLVTYLTVRNLDGHVIGCRMFGKAFQRKALVP